MIIKVRYEILGGQVHCDVFMAKGINMTFENCGHLAFRTDEWPYVREVLFKCVTVEEFKR